MKLDKSKWQLYEFRRVAFNISERVEPNDTEAQIYVGLEHLDSNSIHISRYGKPSDVKGTKLKVYKGDIIFGKRRAYQRKAAIAEFDGICSAHAMVLRANNNVILPELFPYFIHSDAFMNKAIDVSEGSLSPTIKWKTLAQQKFLLPPLNLQKGLADLLWSGDKMILKRKELYEKFLAFRMSTYESLFAKVNTKSMMLNNLPVNIITGLWKGKTNSTSSIYVIRNTEFDKYGEYNLDKLQKINVDTESLNKKRLQNQDIIVEMSGGSKDQPVGRVVFFDLDKDNYSFSNFTKTIRVNDKSIILPKYLFYFLLYFYEFKFTENLQNQTTGIRNLDLNRYLNSFIPIPHLKVQEEIIAIIDNVEYIRRRILNQIKLESDLNKCVINKILEYYD